MANKVTLAAVGSLIDATTAANTINSNTTAIVTAVNNTLSRDGTSPNQMQNSLDMNSNHILNLPAPITVNEPLRLVDANTLNGGGTITVNPLPAGGTAGQILEKNTSTNYDASWFNNPVPTGGTIGQALTKNSSTNFDASWISNTVPVAGTTGQVLTKNTGSDYDIKWATPTSPTSTTFNVRTYGAVANYRIGFGNMAIGSAILTNAAGSFTSADIGKYIAVDGAGASGTTLYTTIASINSLTSCNLTTLNTSGNTLTNKTYEYGTDDAPSFQSAWNACKAAGGGIVYVPKGDYFLSRLNMTNTTIRMTLAGDGLNCTRIFPIQVAAYSTLSGHMFDMTGSAFIDMTNMQIGSNGTLAVPVTCVCMLQVPSNQSNRMALTKMYISGQFSGSAYYNYGVPSLWTIQDCDFYNYSPGAGVKNCMTLTATNILNYNSAFTTVATGTFNCSDIVFLQCEWHKFAGTGADNFVITLDATLNILFLSGVISGGATAYVGLWGTNGPINFTGMTFETENQPVTPLYGYYINTAATLPQGLWDDASFYITTIGKFNISTTPVTQTYATH